MCVEDLFFLTFLFVPTSPSHQKLQSQSCNSCGEFKTPVLGYLLMIKYCKKTGAQQKTKNPKEQPALDFKAY